MENEIFEVNLELGVILCRHCKCGVRRGQAKAHLKGGNHDLPKAIVNQVSEAVKVWPGISQEAEEGHLPRKFDHRIEGLHVYPGILCRREEGCEYVCRADNSMKQHWSTVHGYALQEKSGGRSNKAKEENKAKFERFTRKVNCQQVFTSHAGKHFIAVINEEEEMVQNLPDVPKPKMDEFMAEIMNAWKAKNNEIADVIEGEDKYLVNPWLRRTGWADYLAGRNVEEASRRMELPGEEEGEQSIFESTVKEASAAMHAVAVKSQTVIKALGHSIRMEAVRVEKQQTKREPLLAYMDAQAINDHARFWKQIIVFFCRTVGVSRDWNGPTYGFTRRQAKAFNVLWRRAARKAEERMEGRDDDEEESAVRLDCVQEACLDFAIELLNQRDQGNEYDCALVCALAVMGWHGNGTGWQSVDSYTPILSKMIKVSRFMVVYKALSADEEAFRLQESRILGEEEHAINRIGGSAMEEVAGLPSTADDDEEEVEGPASVAPPIPTTTSSRTARDWLKMMMDSFMIRGTNGPFEWMLDLRTYGLSVHYNSSMPGQIGWTNGDELLYRDKQFTMGDFRGFVHGLVSESRRILMEELLMVEGRSEEKVSIEGLFFFFFFDIGEVTLY